MIQLELFTKQHLSWNPRILILDSQLAYVDMKYLTLYEHLATKFQFSILWHKATFFLQSVCTVYVQSFPDFFEIYWKRWEGTERGHLVYFFQSFFKMQGPDSTSGKKNLWKMYSFSVGRHVINIQHLGKRSCTKLKCYHMYHLHLKYSLEKLQ